MSTLAKLPAVFWFEWRRALTAPRLAWMLALMTFPPLLLALMRLTSTNGEPPDNTATAVLVYVLSPGVACMMSVFLWATPALSTELEGRSWVYLAVRPGGPLAVILGKFLVAVSWAIPVGLVSSALSIAVLEPDQPRYLFAVESALVALSSVAYSALFILIGVIAPTRAMVAGVVYTVIFEVGLAMVPAAMNLLTVQYRLRCLLVRWLELDAQLGNDSPVLATYFGAHSAVWHLTILLLMTGVYLLAAAVLLSYREFTTASETDV